MRKITVGVVGALGFWATVAFGQSIALKMDRADGVYPIGATVHWTVTVDGKIDDLTYCVNPNQNPTPPPDSPLSGTTVDYTFDKPGSVLLTVKGKAADGKEITGLGGAVSALDQIKPSAPRPDDFDAFWSQKIAELRAIPANPQLTRIDVGKPDVQYDKITMDNVHGSHVQGQIARPAKEGKYPAILQLQYAGVYALDKNWVLNYASNGWLSMNIIAHDLPIDEKPDFYKSQDTGAIKMYPYIGNDDRETSYFLRMFLSCVRAVDYLKTRPDWDGHTLVVTGASQGGMQTLMTAALCPDDVTAALADVPAGCDMFGPEVGRAPGWPNWYGWTHGIDWKGPDNSVKVRAAGRYYDVVNFASKIRCPVLMSTGLIDTTCPSDGVAAAFNQIPGNQKQLVLMPGADHVGSNNSHAPFNNLMWSKWLPALQQGRAVPVER